MIRALLVVLTFAATAAAADPYPVGPVPDGVRRAFRLSPRYTKYVDAGGIPVVASDAPSDYALKEAAYLIDRMLEPIPRVRRALIRYGLRCAVIGVREFTTDVPEFRTLQPKNYWNYRARGLGPTPLRRCIACSEENLLQTASDPYRGESIFVHEFGHAIQRGLEIIDPTFKPRLKAKYTEAMKAGLWRGAYASETAGEYWAEGVQSWFDTNHLPDDNHAAVENRAKLKKYDPGLAQLVGSVFGETTWRYRTLSKRAEPGHLTGLDRSKIPAFEWPPELVKWYRLYEQGREPGRAALRLLPAVTATRLRSITRGPPTDVVFINKTKRDVNLVAVGRRGERLPRGNVRPGRSRHVSTYAGHGWLVTDAAGVLLSVVVATAQPGRVVIDGTRAPARPDILIVRVKGPSPALAQLAREGMSFTQAYTGGASGVREIEGDLAKVLAGLGVRAKNTVVIAAGTGGKDLSERGIRIPLVIRWPGQIRPGATSDHLCRIADLHPTILDLTGAARARGLEGLSLLPTLLGHGTQARHPYLVWKRGDAEAIRIGAWKGIRNGKTLEMFHLAKDPGETTNLAAKHPEVARHLERTLDRAGG